MTPKIGTAKTNERNLIQLLIGALNQARKNLLDVDHFN